MGVACENDRGPPSDAECGVFAKAGAPPFSVLPLPFLMATAGWEVFIPPGRRGTIIPVRTVTL